MAYTNQHEPYFVVADKTFCSGPLDGLTVEWKATNYTRSEAQRVADSISAYVTGQDYGTGDHFRLSNPRIGKKA